LAMGTGDQSRCGIWANQAEATHGRDPRPHDHDQSRCPRQGLRRCSQQTPLKAQRQRPLARGIAQRRRALLDRDWAGVESPARPPAPWLGYNYNNSQRGARLVMARGEHRFLGSPRGSRDHRQPELRAVAAQEGRWRWPALWGCNGNVTAVAVGQSQRLYSGVRMFTGNYLSSTRGQVCCLGAGLGLGSRSLICNGHSPRNTRRKCPFRCNSYVTTAAVAVGQRQWLYSGVRVLTGYYLSFF
jgi:hypothetical protein